MLRNFQRVLRASLNTHSIYASALLAALQPDTWVVL